MSAQEAERLWTVSDVLAFVGAKHASSVTRMCQAGMPSYKPPGLGVRFRRHEVEAWLDTYARHRGVAQVIPLRKAVP